MVRWRRVDNPDVEDRRGSPGRRAGGGIPIGGKIGLPAALLLIVVVVLSNVIGGGGGGGGGEGGGDIGDILEDLAANQGQAGAQPAPSAPDPATDPDAETAAFMEAILADVQDMWERLFSGSREYPHARLVLFTDATPSACGGTATVEIGPHYCPTDQTVYLDLGFFRQLKSQFGAPGDFAQAYVLAHEIGHHVQSVTGIMGQVQQAQQSSPDQANELSISLELQADCLAGIWAYTAYQQDILESGDLEEGLRAASAVGDDRLQQQAGGAVNPETWTHGSAEQRSQWFRRGFESGDPDACDTSAG